MAVCVSLPKQHKAETVIDNNLGDSSITGLPVTIRFSGLGLCHFTLTLPKSINVDKILPLLIGIGS